MSRQDTERDIVETLRQVPDVVASMPDDTPAREWEEWRHLQMEDTALTTREKPLIGLGVVGRAMTYASSPAPFRVRKLARQRPLPQQRR